MGDRKKPATRREILFCFSRLASQAGLNSGQAWAHGCTREADAWEVAARTLRAFVRYAVNNPHLPLTGAVPQELPLDGEDVWAGLK